jgi:ubiquinone/menaquinone biosynthesis C-methylase UbiE
MRGTWNHNTHYHRLVLRAMPADAARVLDVGCGEGDLLADLADVAPVVVGVDADAAILERAARTAPSAELIHGDFLSVPLEPGSFDLVAAIASMHHMDFDAALGRARGLLRPGGVLVVVGLAQPTELMDRIFEAVGGVATRALRWIVGYKDVLAPTIWPPPLSYAECRRVALTALPGATFRRRVFFRYSLVWTKP